MRSANGIDFWRGFALPPRIVPELDDECPRNKVLSGHPVSRPPPLAMPWHQPHQLSCKDLWVVF
jgi:hypothetical protein